jgi:hypothetical protein
MFLVHAPVLEILYPVWQVAHPLPDGVTLTQLVI